MDYIIAIPTYRRPAELKEKTIKLLETMETIPPIFLFVENELEEYTYGLFHDYDKIVTNTKGIGAKRNFIKKWCREKGYKYVLQLDDDIEAIIDHNNCKILGTGLNNLFEKGFKECEQSGARLWGINGYNNSFYFKDTVSKNLKFVIGTLNGTIIDDRDLVLTPIDLMEDYYNTIEHFKRDGLVIRLNGYGIKTKFAKNRGGLQELYDNDRTKKEEEMIDWIVTTYSGMATKIKKKRGYDLRLNNKYKSPLHATD